MSDPKADARYEEAVAKIYESPQCKDCEIKKELCEEFCHFVNDFDGQPGMLLASLGRHVVRCGKIIETEAWIMAHIRTQANWPTHQKFISQAIGELNDLVDGLLDADPIDHSADVGVGHTLDQGGQHENA